jgi:hypothetical protein
MHDQLDDLDGDRPGESEEPRLSASGYQPRARHVSTCGRSAPMLVDAPCPGCTTVGSGWRISSVSIESMICPKLE